MEPSDTVAAVLDVVDWRRRTHDLYRRVRDLDPAEGHALWRAGRDELFAHHPASALPPEHRAGFEGLPVEPYDERYRFEVTVEQVDRGDDARDEGFEATTGTDGVVSYRRLGVVHLDAPEGAVTLAVWRLAGYGGGLFVPVRDATSGRTTFGGGRYVLDTVKGADLGPGADKGASTIVLDLNFAYNPSCAYEASWACPLAPAQSTTAVPLPVGEQHRGPWVLA